jgi:acyl-CoA thioesterase-1
MRLIKLPLLLLLALTCIPQPLIANDTSESHLRLLVLGDSLAAGYGLAAEEAFPAQLERALQQAGHDVTVINAGVSGDTTAGGLARLDWALADNPHLVLVELGGNDALRGLPPEETRANLDAILERLGRAGAEVLLAGMQAPRNLGEEYTTAFNRVYPQLAKQHRVAFYPFFLDGVALDPSLNQADGIHPNVRGVAVIVTRILPFVEAALRTLQK